MGNLEALKALYVKLGGSATDVAGMTTLSEVIAATSALEIGGGIGIPDLFLITITFDEQENPTSDKTYAEINAALTAGKVIALRAGQNFSFVVPSPVEGGVSFVVSALVVQSGVVGIMSMIVTITEDSVTVGEPSMYPLVTEP